MPVSPWDDVEDSRYERLQETAIFNKKWVDEMIAARDRLSWRASEATHRLYDIAEKNGFKPTSARKTSFPKAARDIATQIGERKTRDIFIRWVDNFARKHKMI